MKRSSIFRTMVIIITLSLLVLALPATPVLAAVSVSCSPASGQVGSLVTVNGSGFIAGEAFTITFFKIGFTQVVATGTVGPGGALYTTFYIPECPKAQYSVKATATSASYTTYFTVTPQITLSPSSGYVSSTVTISGKGFAPSSIVTFYLDNVNITATSTITNTIGSFASASLTIPADTKGSHTIKAQDGSANYATSTFTVLQRIIIEPASGAVGDQVNINGSGFAASSAITFFWDDVSVSTSTSTTDANGSFTITSFIIPSSSRGSHTIKAQDTGYNSAAFGYTIGEKISITPTTGSSGTTVTVSGSGFRGYKTVSIKYNGVSVSTSPSSIRTDDKGIFTATFNVSAGLAGTYLIEASDGTYSASTNFTATADATISQTTTAAAPGHVGMEITITGTGFKPNATVTVSYASNSVALANVTTDGNGAFSIMVTIPTSAAGTHVLTVTDGHTTKQFTFIMESQAPATPVPLLPEDATKSKSLALFDWEDVPDDPSGLTYTLQVGTDSNFTNVLLQKKDLTVSEYLLTEEEKLESTSKDEPYYWQVRSVDGASNASDWSTPASFYVGFLFSLPSWGIYIIFGLVAILLGVVGFWLGRRTAYY